MSSIIEDIKIRTATDKFFLPLKKAPILGIRGFTVRACFLLVISVFVQVKKLMRQFLFRVFVFGPCGVSAPYMALVQVYFQYLLNFFA